MDAGNVAGLSDAARTKSTTLLSSSVVNSAVSRQLSADWAQDRLQDLFLNVNNTILVNDIREYFQNFIERKGKTTPIEHTLLKGRIDIQKDPLLRLLDEIRNDDRIYVMAKSAPSQAAVSFLHNANNYIITLSPEELGELDEADMETLSSLGAESAENLIVPKSAVFMTDDKYTNRYKNQTYPTFTGADMRIITMTPHVITQNITLKVLTYSIHSGKIPISTLGRDRPKGWAKGDRTIAGTMIATVTINDPLMDLQPILYSSNNDYAKATSDVWRTYLLPDQLPEFDIVALFSNEYGFNGALPIFGISFTDVGSVISMSDSEIEVTYTYTALDIDVMRNITEHENADGTLSDIDILENNEYLVKRERAYKGISEHKSRFEVPALYGRLDSRSREIEYNRARNLGLDINEIINIRGILEGS